MPFPEKGAAVVQQATHCCRGWVIEDLAVIYVRECSAVFSSLKHQITIRRCVDKGVVHIHNGVLLSYEKNAFNSVVMRQMNLEWIKQSESQKEEDKYHILAHTYGIQKDSTDDPTCRAQRRQGHKEETSRHSGKRRGWDDLRE